MIGVLGEKYIGIVKYGTTDAEIFENIDCNHSKNDNLVEDSLNSFNESYSDEISELEEELVGGVV